MQAIVDGLIAAMKDMPVIDAHEHLPSEEEVLTKQADVLTRLFCHYSITNAETAGLPGDSYRLKDTDVPLEERWHDFQPYLAEIQDTGYARVGQIVARDLYGIEEITDDSYLELSQRLQEANRPGLYDQILRKECRIERILNQGSWDDGAGGYAVNVCRELMGLAGATAQQLRGQLERLEAAHGGALNEASAMMDCWVRQIRDSGSVGIKLTAALPADCVADAAAASLYGKLRSGTLEDDEARELGTWLLHKALELAGTYQLPVAVHCGIIWNCWGDFSALNPVKMIPVVMKHRDTVFDLYHGGIPWVREIGVMGNQYPNVVLNLCWCHQISPFMTEQMLNEWLDLVPVNKIIGFGGDNCDGPEKTYGVLVMARENIARALAVRICRGTMTESRAADICRAWLYENPKRIYRLEER